MKTNIAALLAICILAAFMFGCTSSNQSPVSQAQSFVGFSTASVTQMSFQSSNSNLSGPAYLMNLHIDGSSGSARTTVTPEQAALLIGAQHPAINMDLVADMGPQSCTSTLLSNPTPIYEWGYVGTQYYPAEQIDVTGISAGYWLGDQPQGNVALHKRKIGDVYQIDSAITYQQNINISLIANGTAFSVPLSSTNLNGQVPGFMIATFKSQVCPPGGCQQCPIPSITTVLYRAANTNVMVPKSSYAFQTLLTQTATPPGSASIGNSQVQAFLSSSASASSSCGVATPSGSTATYSCTPSSQVGIPDVQVIVKASAVGIVIPSGTPHIVSLSNPTAEAGSTTDYNVTLQNTGTDADSFDLSIQGTPPVNLQASRVAIAAGQRATVPVKIQGAGIIGTYSLIATSANDPSKQDSLSFTLKIDPYCDKQAEAGKTKVSTEYGCYYVCLSATDLREKTCQPFGTFEPSSIAYNRSNQEYLSEKHCTGIGGYATLDDYMDAVITGQIQPFVPVQQPNAYWLDAPYCQYAGMYGYHWDGAQAIPINSLSFYNAQGQSLYSASQGTQQLVYSSEIQTPTTQPSQTQNNSLVCGFGLQLQNGTCVPVETGGGISPSPQNNDLIEALGLIAFALIGMAVVYYWYERRG